MPRRETFISISCGACELLLPQNGVFCAAVSDGDSSCGVSSVYDLDELCRDFCGAIPAASVRTMLLLGEGSERLAFLTSCECKVCSLSLESFSVFSACYEQGTLRRGIIACRFSEHSIGYLLDMGQFVAYRNGLRKAQ